jgi:hypothetical protein
MALLLRRLVILVTAIGSLSAAGSCRAEGKSRQGKGTAGKMERTEIVPGKSIGPLHIGARIDQLPKSARISGPVGEHDGIQFLIENDAVADVWIEDLRRFPGQAAYEGKPIPRDATLAQLKQIFGPCERVGVKGGVFFNCAKGVTLGCDFEEKGQFIQIRLKPR